MRMHAMVRRSTAAIGLAMCLTGQTFAANVPAPLEPGKTISPPFNKEFGRFPVAQVHFTIDALINKDLIDTIAQAGMALSIGYISQRLPFISQISIDLPRPGIAQWSLPNTGEWANYTFCNYAARETDRIPFHGHDSPTWRWAYVKSRSGAITWSLRKTGFLQGKTHLVVEVWYFVIRKDAVSAALKAGVCVAPPNSNVRSQTGMGG